MNTSQVTTKAAQLRSQAQSQRAQVRAAQLAMRSAKGLDFAIASARYATLAFDADLTAKRAGLFAAAAAVMAQADTYSAQGKKNEAVGQLTVAAAMLGMSGTVRKLQMSGPGFISAHMVAEQATPVSASGSSFVRTAAGTTPTAKAITDAANNVFHGIDPRRRRSSSHSATRRPFSNGALLRAERGLRGLGELGDEPADPTTSTEIAVEQNSQTQEDRAFTAPPDLSDVPDKNLATGDGKTQVDLGSGSVQRGMSQVQAGAKKLRDLDDAQQKVTGKSSFMGDLKSVGAAAGVATAVVGAATAAGAGIATALVTAGVLSAAAPAGTIIAGAIVLAVGIYVLVDYLSEDDPPGPTVLETGSLPRAWTGGDPRVAEVILGKIRAEAKSNGPEAKPRAMQRQLVLQEAERLGLNIAPPPRGSAVKPEVGFIAAGAGAGFLFGNLPGAIIGGIVGALLGKR